MGYFKEWKSSLAGKKSSEENIIKQQGIKETKTKEVITHVI